MPRVRLFDDEDRGWMDRAACAGHPNPDIWYPESSNLYTYETRQAAFICSGCPVRAECYLYGQNEKYGIYAGVLMSTGTVLSVSAPPKPRPVAPRKRPAARRQPDPVREHVPDPVPTIEHAPDPVRVPDPVVVQHVKEPVVVVQHVKEPAHATHGVLEPVFGGLRRLSRFLRS